jgi:hypothetical protein
MTASDAHPTDHPLPEFIGYRTPRSDNLFHSHRAGEGLPSSRRHYLNVPPHTPRSPSRLQSRSYTASMAFAPIPKGSALPDTTLTGS